MQQLSSLVSWLNQAVQACSQCWSLFKNLAFRHFNLIFIICTIISITVEYSGFLRQTWYWIVGATVQYRPVLTSDPVNTWYFANVDYWVIDDFVSKFPYTCIHVLGLFKIRIKFNNGNIYTCRTLMSNHSFNVLQNISLGVQHILSKCYHWHSKQIRKDNAIQCFIWL